MSVRGTVLALVCTAIVMRPARAQDDHQHGKAKGGADTSGVGEVRFPNSGNSRAQAPFIRGIALLHSFDYDAAAAAFQQAESADPGFALPYWFEALTHSAILWNVDDPPAGRQVLLKLGATPAARLAKARTARERAYGAAIEAFYADTDATTRTRGFADSMSALALRDTADLEASAFASVATQMYAYQRTIPPAERTARVQRAIAFADRVYRARPKHPGAAHYLIHISDFDNAFAAQALQPAFDYARIAPAVEHAQHMPSHVFLKLGMWHDQVAANERAWQASVNENARAHQPGTELDYHDFLWLQYGYLQEGRWALARALIDSARHMIAGLDSGSTLTVDSHYAPAMLEYAYASETGDWRVGPRGAITTKMVGPAAARVREAGFATGVIFARIVTALMQGDTSVVSSISTFPDSSLPRLELDAILADRRGNRETAVGLWRRAAVLDDANAVIGPPRFLYAREQLAAELLAMGRANEAATEYQRALFHTPNRSATLLGLARARVASGDSAAAALAYRRLLDNWLHADADLVAMPEVKRGAVARVSRVNATADPITKKPVAFKNGSLLLEGFLFKPAGNGPFPAVVWNHGSEHNPGSMAQFDSMAAVFVPHGYVLFAPTRRGHGQSDGEYILDVRSRTAAARGNDAGTREMNRLITTDHLGDQLAGLAFLKSLPFVDTTRMLVAGCSFGGIQTLVAAEGGHGYKAALPISPAAMNWDHNTALRQRLLAGVSRIDIPVFLLQPPHDASLGPSRDLGAEFKRLHKSYVGKVYPTTLPAPEQEHCFGGGRGAHVWANDALAFFDSVLATAPAPQTRKR